MVVETKKRVNSQGKPRLKKSKKEIKGKNEIANKRFISASFFFLLVPSMAAVDLILTRPVR